MSSACGTRLSWVCGACQHECIPIRSESRCLCGHRHKEHDGKDGWRCKSANCACSGFYYIVAEGAWILRCRCKHKHVEHDAATHACARPGCACTRFNSPWVCNCDHPWAEHRQIEVPMQQQKQQQQQGEEQTQGFMETVQGFNRWDLVRRGGDASGMHAD